jgi:hypothetical protein
VSFSMWTRQDENRTGVRESTRTLRKPPQRTFVPWSRSAAGHRQRCQEDTDNWI